MIKKVFQKIFIKVLCSLLILGLNSIYGLEKHFYADPRQQHGLRKTARDFVPQKRFNANLLMARKTIRGVIHMYSNEVEFEKIAFTVNTDGILEQVNASYTHGTQTFDLPYIVRSGKLYATAGDQGIVSHEAGHMILNYLKILLNTNHTGAIHEAFADLTAHFYRFYNKSTRAEFLAKMTYDKGCVGDTNFTCTRNNSQPLRLSEVALDESLCEVHEFSTPFSNAVYENMLEAYQNRGLLSQWFTWGESEAVSVVTWHRRTLVKAIFGLSSKAPTLMDLAEEMLRVSFNNPLYRNGLGHNFIKNGLIVLLYSSPKTPYYSQNKKYARLCLTKQPGKSLRLIHPRPRR